MRMILPGSSVLDALTHAAFLLASSRGFAAGTPQLQAGGAYASCPYLLSTTPLAAAAVGLACTDVRRHFGFKRPLNFNTFFLSS